MSRFLQTVSLSNHVYHCLIAAPVLLVSPGNAFAIPSISVSSSHVPHASRGVRTSNDDSVSHDVGALPYPGGWLICMASIAGICWYKSSTFHTPTHRKSPQHNGTAMYKKSPQPNRKSPQQVDFPMAQAHRPKS